MRVLGNESNLTGRSNDMIGLTSFAGFVEENTPLTLDHQSLVVVVQEDLLSQLFPVI